MNQQGWHLGESFPIRVMALMLRDPDFLPKFQGDIEHHYFEKKDLCNLAHLVLNFFKTREKVPLRDEVIDMIVSYASTYDADGLLAMRDTLISWLDFCLNYAIGDDGFIKDRIRGFGMLQRLKSTMVKTFGMFEAVRPEDDPLEEANKILALYEDACRPRGSDEMGTLLSKDSYDLPQILRDDAMYGRLNKIPTGIVTLDEALNGGVGCPELAIIAALPNIGKTTVLCAIGASAARFFHNRFVTGQDPVMRSVIHITCEVPDQDVKVKYMANLTDMEISEIPLYPDRYHALHRERFAQFAPVHVKYCVPGTTTVEDIKWYVNQVVMQDGLVPGLLVLDYPDRLKGGEDDRFTGMGKIYDGLIAINNKFKIPTWAASQLNRATTAKAYGDGSGLTESWKKLEYADVIVSLNRNPNDEQAGRAVLYTAKNRRGRAREFFFCHFNPGKVFITAMSKDEVKTAGLDKKEESEDMGERLTNFKNKNTKKQGDEEAPPAPMPAQAAFGFPDGAPGNVVPTAPPGAPPPSVLVRRPGSDSAPAIDFGGPV